MSRARSTQDLRCSDAAISSAAQREFARPIVVEAGAGTGKTTLLINRCLAWVLGRGWLAAEARLGAGDEDRVAAEVLSRVAAITFTEAAAAEMARRLGEALAVVAGGGLPVGVDADAWLATERLRAPRARALIGALDRWVVRTIHAFCRRLLAQHALAAGLHPDFQVDADARVACAVAREVVEAAVRDGYDEPGDADLLALGVEEFGPAEVEDALVVLLREAVEPRALEEAVYTPEVVARLVGELGSALRHFTAADGERLAGVNKSATITIAVVKALAATTEALARCGGDVPGFDAFTQALRAHWPTGLRKRLGAWCEPEGFNASEQKVLGAAAPGVAAAAKFVYCAIEHAVELRPLRFERGRRVLRPLLARAREKLRERGAIGYGSLLRETRDLLRDQPAVCVRVRSEFDQLLVDEFQDTDPVQCDIVRLLALSGAAESRPGLFLVGDPKQSIYGWRAADLRAYASLVRDALGPSGEPMQLCVNRRSTPAILDEVERVLEPVMTGEGPNEAPFQPLVASEEREREAAPHAAPRSFVEHWISWPWDTASGRPRLPNAREAARLEAQALARDLVALKRAGGFAWRDAGVLLRTWTDLEIYLEALREADVPYAVEGGRSYYRRREVIDASGLVCCVLDPNDHLALLTWLRSPSVGVPDGALIPLWTRDFPRLVSALSGPDEAALVALDRVIAASLAELPEDIPGLDRIPGWDRNLAFAVAGIAALRASFERDASDVFIEKLRALSLLEVTEAARFPGAFRLANLERFFRELRAELESDAMDVQGVLRRLRSDVVAGRAVEDASPPTAGEDAVRFMTIHGAKGLEFRHCYIVQLHKGRGGRRNEPEAASARELDGRWEYQLFDAPTLGYAGVEARKREVEAAERVRGLYVAMTRARDRLVLLGAWPLEGRAMRGVRSETLVDLLGSRRGVAPGLVDAITRAHAEGRDGLLGEEGVRWSFPALRSADASPASLPIAALRDAAAAIEADAQHLESCWLDAARRMGRRFRAPASGDSHAQEREARADRQFSVPGARAVGQPADAAPALAAAAGTAVHRALEALRLAVDPREDLALQQQRLPAWIASLLRDDELAPALERAREVLARFEKGPLLERLAALRDHVIARELPVLLPAEAEGDGPVGFITGAIDLLYRDPTTNEFVVVDYKTDRVEGDAALAERAERYAGQAAHYQRAVREALALPRPPRFELWFLHAGAVVPVG